MIDDELGAKFQANFCKILKFEKSGDFNGGYETFQEMEIFKSMFVKVIRHCGLIQHHFFFLTTFGKWPFKSFSKFVLNAVSKFLIHSLEVVLLI